MGEIGLYGAVSSCRAVRRQRPDPIPDEVVRRLIEAATWAPTGANSQPWRVIAVRDADTKQRLQEHYLGPWNAYEKNARQAFKGLGPEALASQERVLAAAQRAVDAAAQSLGVPGPQPDAVRAFYRAQIDAAVEKIAEALA